VSPLELLVYLHILLELPRPTRCVADWIQLGLVPNPREVQIIDKLRLFHFAHLRATTLRISVH
jgi:hypothetical protein